MVPRKKQQPTTVAKRSRCALRRMFSVLAVATLVAAMIAVAALPAFAEGKNPPTSCGVGNAVSEATHEIKEAGLGGLGKAAHTLDFGNVGNEVIQPFHEDVKATCNA